MKLKIAHRITLLTFCCMVSGQLLAVDDIVLRSKVTPEDPWVGQKALLHIEVLAKDGWAQLKKVGDTNIDGAHLLRLESQGTRLNETIDGDSYTGQRYTFLVFTQRDGEFRIPPVPVDVEVRTWGAGAGTELRRMSLPGVEFTARTPPGASGIRGLVSTTSLTANQTWAPETDSPEIGDAITRTVTLRAEDVSGMAFAPLRYNEIAGLGTYPGGPEVEDNYSRGALTGTRVETVTYVFERPGEVEIPDFELSWWDVGSSELKRIDLPGLSVEVVGTLIPDPEMPADATRTRDRPWLLILVLAAAIAVGVAFFGRRISRWVASWRKARQESEAHYFRQVMRSARSGNRNELLRDTMCWLDRINDGPRPARLDEFLQKFGDAETQSAASDLLDISGARQDKRLIRTFASGLVSARKHWSRAQQVGSRIAGVLPELNG